MRLSEPCECCTTCPDCARHYCRDDYSACPDCPPEPSTGCGRLDPHCWHEWRTPYAGPFVCTGELLIEGGYDGGAA